MAEDIRKKISGLNTAITDLDIKFNLYFSGREALPPVKNLEILKREVKRCVKAKNILMSASMQFYVTTFQHRFASYQAKWERKLRDIEAGRTMPGKNF